jgi:predicted DNA-binding WGR domain protein
MSSVNHQVYNAFKGKIFYTFNIEDNPMVSLYDTIGWAGFFEKKWFLTETQYREQRINKILEKD